LCLKALRGPQARKQRPALFLRRACNDSSTTYQLQRMDNHNVNEEAFLKAFRSGHEWAFDKAFRQWFGPLSFYAFQLTKDEQLAEDIVQDAFVKLWARRKKLDGIKSLKSYLYRCVYAGVVDNFRARKLKYEDIEQAAEEAESEILVTGEILAQISQLIEQLPPRMKAVLQMYYFQNKSLAEIGKEIGIDPETVRSHRYRGLQLIKNTIIPT
jgi:RNA polymerase sigma factor (sigma-70 family)